MTTLKPIALLFALFLSLSFTGFAQQDDSAKPPTLSVAAAPSVTMSLTTEGVRFSVPGAIGQLRLEVFDHSGVSLYNSDFRPANVFDWPLQNKERQALADGTYLCVVTLRSIAGKLSVKQGMIVVQNGQAALQLDEAQSATLEPERALTAIAASADSPANITVHDGQNAQVTASATGTGTANKLAKWIDGSGTLGDSGLAELNGRIGIGITNPSVRLDLVETTGQAQPVLQFRDTAADSPRARLHAGTESGVTKLFFEFWKDNTPSRAVAFGMANPGVTTLSEDFIFSTYNGMAWSERMRIQTATGNVGIGTVNPAQKLDVAGSIKLTGAGNGIIFPDGTTMTTATTGGGGSVSGSGTTGAVPLWSGSTALGNSAITQTGSDVLVNGNFSATGNLSAKYQDVAEWVPARGRVQAGTVVSLDRSRNNTVMPSARAYDTHVAGVVSARPGLVLGEGAAGRVMVATTGRVKVRVDARRGAVRVGDLLVTSGTQGVAMRSRPVRVGGIWMHRPGTILGKALEPLQSGTGEILVLLSLQ